MHPVPSDSEEFSGAKRDECRAKAEGIASYLLKQWSANR